MTSPLTFILVPSSHCNLRCSYCYVYPYLGDKRRTSLDDLARVFAHIAVEYRARAVTIRFVWHGGEPLLLPPEYYREALARQRAAFDGTECRIENSIQTNLTVLDEERISLLRTAFDTVGVSLDLYGELRVDQAGVPREQRTRTNLEVLRSRGVTVGGITVLSRANVDRVPEIFEFYRERDMQFRILPVHRGPFPGQNLDLTPAEVREALCLLVDLVLESRHFVPVLPITSQIAEIARAHLPGAVPAYYDKQRDDFMFIVDRDGSVYGYNDPFDQAHCFGNLIGGSMAAVLASEARRQVASAANQRVLAACRGCEFYGRGCSSFPIAEGAQDYARLDEDGQPICDTYQGLFAHIRKRLFEHGIIDRETGLVRSELRARFVPRPSSSALL